MKLQTKLGLALLPVIFLTVSFLGFWSIRTVGQELEEANSRYMRKVLDSYTEETVAAHYSLLEKNALQNVESFVTAYQQKAFEAADAAAEAEGGHFLIFDGTGRIQSMTQDLDPGREGREWEEAYPLIQTALSGSRPGRLKTSEGSELFVVRRFSPWDWTILFSIHESSIIRVKREIAEVTLILTAVSLAVCSLMVLLILKRFFVRPVSRLSAAADYIAENKDSYRIGISSRDEIGGLSRTMEDLSDAIGAYRRELTEWNRQLEEKIKERTRDLERSNAELEQFAYVASHDLQEPLRSVSGFLQLLEKRYETELDEDALRYIQRAVGASKRMQEMIQSLLAYSRIGTKGQPFRDVDCNEVVRKVLENLKDAVTRENADVSCGPLPVVPGDEIQLIQLFQNLVSNALKYNKETVPEVRIRAEERDRNWLFAVEDNGIGIDPRFSERIFQIFQRLHGRTEYSGTGIGLAVCRKIVERHNGEIWAEPGSDRGSVFRFTLPRTGEESNEQNL